MKGAKLQLKFITLFLNNFVNVIIFKVDKKDVF